MFAHLLPVLSPTQQQLLREQPIDDRNPGTILADFGMLLDFLGPDGVEVGGQHGLLPLGALARLNARLASPMQVAMKRPLQKSYGCLHGLYLLLRATGLGRVRRAGKSQRLVLDPNTLASWQGLNPTERYCTLLEAWLIHARDAMIGGRDNLFLSLCLPDVVQLFGAIGVEGGSSGETIQGHYHNHYRGEGCHLPLLSLFGLVDLEQDTPSPKGSWRVRWVRRRPFGQALLAALWAAVPGLLGVDLDGPEEEEGAARAPRYGVAQDGLSSYFPAWRHNLTLPEEAFREGVHVFRAALGRVWRRIAVSGAMTLDDLAHAILKTFQFDTDHLYCFLVRDRFGIQVSVNAPYMEDGPWTDETRVGDVPLDVGTAMTYVFDFGDNWRFEVTLEEVRAPDRRLKKPRLLAKEGEAPEQYPSWEEDE